MGDWGNHIKEKQFLLMEKSITIKNMVKLHSIFNTFIHTIIQTSLAILKCSISKKMF